MRKSIEYKADRYMKTGWDAWNELVQKGYEAFGKQKAEIGEGLRFWQEAWDIFESIMNLVLEVETLYDDSRFRCGIGESLFWEGKIEEA